MARMPREFLGPGVAQRDGISRQATLFRQLESHFHHLFHVHLHPASEQSIRPHMMTGRLIPNESRQKCSPRAIGEFWANKTKTEWSWNSLRWLSTATTPVLRTDLMLHLMIQEEWHNDPPKPKPNRRQSPSPYPRPLPPPHRPLDPPPNLRQPRPPLPQRTPEPHLGVYPPPLSPLPPLRPRPRRSQPARRCARCRGRPHHHHRGGYIPPRHRRELPTLIPRPPRPWRRRRGVSTPPRLPTYTQDPAARCLAIGNDARDSALQRGCQGSADAAAESALGAA